MSADGQPSFRYPEGVLVREVQGELVLLNLRTEQYFALDRVGADILSRLTRDSVEDVLTSLEADYAVEGSVLMADIETLLDELLREGLIEQTGPPIPPVGR